MGHRDALLDRSGHIDAVVADAKNRHHARLRQLLEQAARYQGLAGAGHAQDARGQRREGLWIGLVGAVVNRVEAV